MTNATTRALTLNTNLERRVSWTGTGNRPCFGVRDFAADTLLDVLADGSVLVYDAEDGSIWYEGTDVREAVRVLTVEASRAD